MIAFQLYDSFTVLLEGSGMVFDRIKSTLRPFQVDNYDTVNVHIKSIPNLNTPSIDALLGGLEEHYGVHNGKFAFVQYGEPVLVSNNQSKIRCSSQAPPDLVRLLVEWKLRNELLMDGYTMIHASGVKYQGESILFPAWRHTGKTNTMLTLLQNGASYISDDRLFVGENGKVLGYPTDVHLLSYNYRSFPGIAPDTRISNLRTLVSKQINELTQSRSSKISKGINLVNEAVITENDWLAVDELFTNVETITQTELDRITLLRTTTAETPRIENICGDELCASLSAINYREWDMDLLEISSAQQSLTGDGSFLNGVERMVEKQREIFDKLHEKSEINLLYVPREETWSDDTKEKIIKLIENT